jgi:hypothetical protein
MRMRTAVSAALVSLAAVLTMVVTGPGPAQQPEAAQSLVIVTEPDDVPAAWDCPEV